MCIRDRPTRVDKMISYIIVSPDMHKVHHHFELPHTDSNYGNIFSIWDRIFGTSIKVDDLDDLKYGLDTHMNKKETSNIKTMLLIPFGEYRPPVGSKFGKND